MKRILRHIVLAAVCVGLAVQQARAADSVYIEDMTWMEVRDAMQHGKTTIIIPTGGTEQNGPHMVIGKHNIIVHFTAGRIAEDLGNALVAPVLAYVPEGRISPAEGHMQFPGTISVTDEAFAAVLEDTARSFKQHGFHLICFLGDHGGSQPVQDRVAQALSGEWHDAKVKVINVTDYYKKNGQTEWLMSRGEKEDDANAHAGLADTSEVMAIDPQSVRSDLRRPAGKGDYPSIGTAGDSTHATAQLGKHLLGLKVEAAVNQIRSAAASR